MVKLQACKWGWHFWQKARSLLTSGRRAGTSCLFSMVMEIVPGFCALSLAGRLCADGVHNRDGGVL